MEFVTSHFAANITFFALGVWILIKGSDGVIESASTIARQFRISEMIIGLTLVSIGTSLPELATNIYASLIKQGSIAIGNIVGSNITNVLLVAGIAITGLGSIKISKITLYRDSLVMFVAYVILAGFCYFFDEPRSVLGRAEGTILFLGFCIYVAYLLKFGGKSDESRSENLPSPERNKTIVKAFVISLFSCFLVVLGAKLMVDNVVWAARKLNISEEIISGTIIALGTSLPEIAVTLAGLVKKKRDIALGNIIGSNTFNVILVMGVTAMINPVLVSPEIKYFMLPYMMFTGILFILFMRTSWTLVRWEGIVFLLAYLFFIGNNLRKMTQ